MKAQYQKVAVYILIIGWLYNWADLVAQNPKTLVREGNKLYKKEKYEEAEINYRKALDKNSNMAEAVFNLGDAIYEQKRFDEAAQQFEQSAKISDNKIKAKALHNLGNSMLSQRKYKEAAEAFKASLKINPKDEDTRYNLAYANAMMRIQQEQQNQQNNKNEQNQNDKQKQNSDNKNKENDKKENNQSSQNDNSGQTKNEDQKREHPKLSKQDAEKLLQALQNEEQKANQKMQKANMIPAKAKVEKDW